MGRSNGTKEGPLQGEGGGGIMGWFSVSFPGSKKAGKREISDMRKFATRYEYKLRQNPDKKGWTIFGRMK